MIMRNTSILIKIFVAHAYVSCVTMCDKLTFINYRKGAMNIYEYEIYFKSQIDIYNALRTLALKQSEAISTNKCPVWYIRYHGQYWLR